MKELHGRGAAAGCACGVVKRYESARIEAVRRPVKDIPAEIEKLERARAEYSAALAELQQQPGQAKEAAGILQAYQEILQDDVFFSTVAERAAQEQVNVDYALQEEAASTAEAFGQLDDPYLADRAVDIRNICDEITLRIQGRARGDGADLSGGTETWIVFAEDLTPDATLRMDKSRLGGFVTKLGGLTSHTVILAKSLGIPAVVGAADAMDQAQNGDSVILYGDSGRVILNPDEAMLRDFQVLQDRQKKVQAAYAAVRDRPAVTKDGTPVQVCVNLGDGKTDSALAMADSDGVGLFRTEFIYIAAGHNPTEEEQFTHYRDVAVKANGRPVIIRTLDIGGDKQVSYLNLPAEANPFLGYRAIRLCLDRKELFLTQLKAILRASAYGNLKIMFPMIASLSELRAAKAVLAQARRELDAAGVAYAPDIPVGIMVETPAAVMISDQLARESAFFSIGTNDLTQYITATDRMNERVQYLYDPCSPSVLRAIRMVSLSAKRYGIPVGMCGEAASDALAIPLWLAMGLSELSVVPSQMAQTKYVVGRISESAVRARLSELLDLENAEAVRGALRGIQQEFGTVPIC